MKKILMILLFGILFISFATAQYSNPTIHWKLDESGFPIVLNDTQGILNLTSNNTILRMVNGRVGNAIRINNSNVIVAQNSTQIRNNFILDQNNFTIAFWINASNGGGGTGYNILSRGGTSATKWAISTMNGNNNISFAVNSVSVLTSPNYTLNSTYNRVVFVREGTGANKFRVFVNGINTANGTLANNLSDTTERLTIDSANGGSSGYNLDDIRIYNGYAWNINEILTDYLTSDVAVYLNTPSNGQSFTTIPNFNITYLSGNNLKNATIFIWDSSLNLTYSENRSISNLFNETIFNPTLSNYGTYTWNVLGCNSNNSCNFAPINQTFYYGLTINSINYNPSTVVGAVEYFSLNGNLSSSSGLTSVSFVYDGVYQTSTYSLIGDIISINDSKNINSAGSKNFYWIFNFTSGSIITNSYTQTVSNLSIPFIGSSCPTGYTQSYKFNVSEEGNSTPLTSIPYNYVVTYGVSNAYSLNLSGSITTNDLYLCFNFTSSPTYKIGYGEVTYKPSSLYPLRKFLFFQNQTITNTTNENKSLFALSYGEQTTFDLTVIDRSSLLPYTGYYVALLRWYPSENQYKIVDMGILDGNGKTPIHVVVEDIDYRVAVYTPSGTLINLANPRRLVCLIAPCTYTLSIEAEQINLNQFLNIQNELTYNSTTGIWTFVYNDPSQATTLMNLTVWIDSDGRSRAICTSTSTAYTGVITCNTSLYTGTLRAEVYRSASPPIIITQAIINTLSSVFKSQTGLFITLLIIIPIIFALGYVSPIFGIIAGVVALIPALYFGAISYIVVTAFAVLGGVILHVLNKI